MILQRFGFERITQSGSHVKLGRRTQDGVRQTIIVPAHPELDRGTLHAIFAQASQFVPADELRPWFYSE